jgi:serine/threonine protein kinase
MAYELACGAPPFVSDNHFELTGRQVHEAALPPSQRGSSLGPAGDALLLRFLAKSPADRFQNVEEAIQSVEHVRALLFPRGKPAVPSKPILGDASMIRYSTDVALSLVSFPEDMRSVEDTDATIVFPMEAVFTDDTGATAIDADPMTLADGHAHGLPLIGRYVMIRVLGEGGLGKVYLARDAKLNRVVAIKVSGALSSSSHEAHARFEREAMLTAQLVHPNIVKIHDMGEQGSSFYVVLEYVDGGDLSQRLREQTWPPDAAARLVATLARGVAYAHSLGILHRDLKPSNILLTKEGTPKISDFGLAKQIGEVQVDAALTQTGTFMGTPSYMAPEQVRGEIDRIGPGTDIHALGAILYELLAGRRPFTGGTIMETLMQVREHQPEPPSRWRAEVPRDLDAICLKCLAKDPQRRYSTAAVLADDLERFLAGQAVTARPPGAWDRLRQLFSFKRSTAGSPAVEGEKTIHESS